MGLLDGEIAELVADALGGVIFLDATLTRDVTPDTSPDYESFDPPAPEPITYTCKAIRTNYSTGYMAQGFVNAGDVKITILQQTLGVTPQPGDRIAITGMGGPWSIVPANSSGAEAVKADPANATWTCRARA